MPKKSKREAGVGKRGGGAASNKVDMSGGSDDEDSLYNDAGSVSSMGISEVSTAVGEYRSSRVSIRPRAPAGAHIYLARVGLSRGNCTLCH